MSPGHAEEYLREVLDSDADSEVTSGLECGGLGPTHCAKSNSYGKP
jgi:hypothetical protein